MIFLGAEERARRSLVKEKRGGGLVEQHPSLAMIFSGVENMLLIPRAAHGTNFIQVGVSEFLLLILAYLL